MYTNIPTRKINVSPKMVPFSKEILLSNHQFSGDMLVFGGVHLLIISDPNFPSFAVIGFDASRCIQVYSARWLPQRTCNVAMGRRLHGHVHFSSPLPQNGLDLENLQKAEETFALNLVKVSGAGAS